MGDLSAEGPSGELLYLLYRATLDWSRLEDFLELASRESRSHNVCMLVQDHVNVHNSSVFTNREGREAAEIYPDVADHNIYLDATRKHFSPGVVLRTNTLIDDRELVNSLFYEEYCRKADIHHCMGINLRTDDNILVGLSFNREKNAPFSEADQRWAEKLAPHLQTFMTTNERLAISNMNGDAAWAVLEIQHYGIQVFDENHKPVFVNKSMEALVASSEILHWRGGQVDARVRELSTWMAICHDRLDASGLALEPMALVRTWGEERYQFMFAPIVMRDGYRERTFSVLIIADLNERSCGFGENLTDAYQLTPRETEVAILLVQGYSTHDIAERLGVAQSTVLSHKKSLFQKTDVHRQSDLVRLAMSFGVKN